jgi:hypothetical protein
MMGISARKNELFRSPFDEERLITAASFRIPICRSIEDFASLREYDPSFLVGMRSDT